MILSWNACEYGWGAIRVDSNGRKQWGSKVSASHLATDGQRLFLANGGRVGVVELADARSLNFQPGMPYLIPPAGGTNENNIVTGLVCDGERIFAAYAARDLVAVYELSGNLLTQWPVPAPGELAVTLKGQLALISGNRLLLMENGKIIKTIAENLDSPKGLAVAEDGTLFVALSGDVQQVWVFDLNGKRLQAIGRKGGRPAMGRYDPSGMYQPGGIELDSEGRLWVAETADGPKRISVWDVKTGENIEEFFGASSYFACGMIDPARPDEIYTHLTLWKIDWENYTVTPYSTVWRPSKPDQVSAPLGDGYASHARMMTANDGKQYMWGLGGRAGGGVLLQRKGDIFIPFLRLAGGVLWQDANNDQAVQPEEETEVTLKGVWRPRVEFVARDLSMRLQSGHRLPVNHFSDSGFPVYDPADLEQSPLPGPAQYLYEDEGGDIYSYSGGVLAKYTSAGEQVWRYTGILPWRKALGMPVTGPGRLWAMTGAMGVAGDFIAHMTYFGVNHMFTRNGDYVAALLQDSRLGGTGEHKGQPEGQRGAFVKLNLNGKDRYFISHGGQDSRVWEVLGLDSIQWLDGGVYNHTEEAARIAARALEGWKAATETKSALKIVKSRDALDRALPVVRKIDDGREFEVRAAYDNANLYLQYDVTSPHQLVNSIPEDNLVFHGGNCLDLQIAADPEADRERTEPAPGDIRLLVTRKDKKTFAMLYRPKISDFSGEPVVLESPTGTESFDEITATDRVNLEYEKTDRGFIALLTVPLDLLQWQPRSGETVKMDVGYIFGNASGGRAAIRGYWSNNSFTANVVDDVPHESRLEPGQWGEAEIE